MDKDSADFLRSEYEQCWDFIKFHYEQRDRIQRFYFTLVLAGGGLVATLYNGTDAALPQSYLLGLILPLVLVGVLTLAQLIELRKTTTLYHKTVVAIRSQLIGSGTTPLWISDDNPRFFTKGFNFFTALIVMLTTAILWSLGVYVALSDFSPLAVIWRVSLAFVVGISVSVGQVYWYQRVLTQEDDRYAVRSSEGRE